MSANSNRGLFSPSTGRALYSGTTGRALYAGTQYILHIAFAGTMAQSGMSWAPGNIDATLRVVGGVNQYYFSDPPPPPYPTNPFKEVKVNPSGGTWILAIQYQPTLYGPWIRETWSSADLIGSSWTVTLVQQYPGPVTSSLSAIATS